MPGVYPNEKLTRYGIRAHRLYDQIMNDPRDHADEQDAGRNQAGLCNRVH